jgi:hypothetical protein
MSVQKAQREFLEEAVERWLGTTGLQRCYWLALPAEVRRTVVGHRQTRKAVGARAIPGTAHVPKSCGSPGTAIADSRRASIRPHRECAALSQL